MQRRRGWSVLGAACALLATACLDPQVSDDVPPSGLVLPAGTPVESIYDYDDLSEQVREHDGVGDRIQRLSGFAGGDSIVYWDFGEAPQNAAPIFALYWGDLSGPLGETWDFASDVNIIDKIPGDDNYSPFWSIFLFKVTDDYDGHIIPSFAAIEEAIELGLLHPEPTELGAYSNCPVVHRDVRLEVGLDTSGDDQDGGQDGLLAPIPVYYRGKMAMYFDFARAPLHGPRPLIDELNVPIQHQFVLRRPGQPHLSETRRGVDITGDGDVTDTNDVFPGALADPENYSPLRHSWSVTVPDTYNSIDTSGDETVADFQAYSDLFSGEDPFIAVPGNVLAVEDDRLPLRNLPIQSERGGM